MWRNIAPARGLLVLLFCLPAAAQAPPSIQFFMPDGSLPPRELRFTLTSDTGLVDTFHTDSKGRFLITRSQGLRPDVRYTITVQGDGRSFDTTTYSFKEYNVYYITVFLRPLKSASARPAGVVDLAELDALAPEGARAAYEGAMRALRSGQVGEAIASLDRALAIYPDYFRAHNDLGVIYMKLNRLEESARAFERATRIAPRVYTPRLNLAIVRTRQGKYGEAVEMLQKLHKENPAVVEILTPLADALMAAGRLGEAEPHLRAALADDRLEPGARGDAHYQLGLLLNRQQQYGEAVKSLAEAARLLPQAPRIRLQLGGALSQVRRLEEAERELLEAYRLGGAEMGAAQFLLGGIYFQQKKYESAMRAFEQYLADVPQAPNAAQVREVIEKIKAATPPR